VVSFTFRPLYFRRESPGIYGFKAVWALEWCGHSGEEKRERERELGRIAKE
jgi:hypothetical protein